MLYTALEHAVEGQLIDSNPMQYVKRPKQFRKEMRVLTLDEEATLIQAVREWENMNAIGILIMLFCGLRIGELLALKWDDIDFRQNHMRIVRTVSRITDEQGVSYTVEKHVKTRDSYRTIPIIDKLSDDLQRHYLLQSIKFGEMKYVFVGKTGKRNEPRNYQTTFQRIAKKAGISGATPHTMRHTFATRCLESGMDIKTLADLLGHADPQITLYYYGHSLPEHKIESVAKLSQFYF